MRVAIFLMLTGCAPKVIPFDASRYSLSFAQMTGKEVHSTIGFGEVSNGIAYCDLTSKTIVIDRERWNSLVEVKREALLFHEMIHCELGILEHETRMIDSCPYSYLNAGNFRSYCYEINREHYRHQLHSY